MAQNTLTDSGGIYVRAEDRTIGPGSPLYGKPGYTAEMRHDPVWNTLIANNTVSNPAGQRLAFVAVALAQIGAGLHGNSVLGVEMRSNSLNSFHPGLNASETAGVNTDGYWDLITPDGTYPEIPGTPGMLGTLFSDNAALNVTGQPYHFGTGGSQTSVALPGTPGWASIN